MAAGSLILSTRAPIGYIARTNREVAFNQGCKALVPITDIDARYYTYVLGSSTRQLQGLGQGSTFAELSNEALLGFAVPAPPLAAQRKIADFLDAETARIDALVAKERQLREALVERRVALFEHALMEMTASRTTSSRAVTLGQILIQLTNGYVGPTRDLLVEEGVRYLQGTHIKDGQIKFERRPFYVPLEWHLNRPPHLPSGW